MTEVKLKKKNHSSQEAGRVRFHLYWKVEG